MRRLLLLVVLLTRVAPAQVPDTTSRATGAVRLDGTVIAAASGAPLAGARVRIEDGPESRTNERGEWILPGVLPGTRMLEIRAVGYYPERRAVNVVAGATPIVTALSTVNAVLDTVTVTADRDGDRLQSGFAERRRMGLGRYLTPEDIARRQPIATSHLFHMVPGVRLHPKFGETEISMRGVFANRCSPAVYLDGHYMRQASADEIDGWVTPNEVAGIEFYAGGTAPPQFNPGMFGAGCGSIVIWTRPVAVTGYRVSLKRRIFMLLGAVTLGLVVGAAVQ